MAALKIRPANTADLTHGIALEDGGAGVIIPLRDVARVCARLQAVAGDYEQARANAVAAWLFDYIRDHPGRYAGELKTAGELAGYTADETALALDRLRPRLHQQKLSSRRNRWFHHSYAHILEDKD